MRDVVITGIGSTRFGKLEGQNVQSIAAEAANAAIARSGVARKDIGAAKALANGTLPPSASPTATSTKAGSAMPTLKNRSGKRWAK